LVGKSRAGGKLFFDFPPAINLFNVFEDKGGVMKLRHKIGFGIYLLNLIMATAGGFVYFFSSKMMPYHAQVIGKSWAELDRGIQLIILALMQVLGAGVIAVSFIALVVLFIPFRRGERWTNWMLFLGFAVYSGLSFFVTFKVYLATNASTPWPLHIISMVLGLLAFLFSMGMEKEKK
jgi:hypothetical protein